MFSTNWEKLYYYYLLSLLLFFLNFIITIKGFVWNLWPQIYNLKSSQISLSHVKCECVDMSVLTPTC